MKKRHTHDVKSNLHVHIHGNQINLLLAAEMLLWVVLREVPWKKLQILSVLGTRKKAVGVSLIKKFINLFKSHLYQKYYYLSSQTTSVHNLIYYFFRINTNFRQLLIQFSKGRSKKPPQSAFLRLSRYCDYSHANCLLHHIWPSFHVEIIIMLNGFTASLFCLQVDFFYYS